MVGIILPYKSKINLSKKKIYSIIQEKFPNSKITSVTSIEDSFVNPIFSFVLQSGEEYILKVNNPQWPSKQNREIYAINYVSEHTSIPVPRIIADSTDGSLSYLIMEKVTGIDLRNAVLSGSISSDDFLFLVKEIGSYLGQMHSLTFDFFGDMLTTNQILDNQQFFWGKQFKTWSDCFRAFCLDMLHWVDTTSFPDYRSLLREKINYYSSKMTDTEKACFVHSDIQPTNIIVNQDRISAIIDFEWSYAGSPSFDFFLTKAGFYFSAFPSLTPSKMYQNYPTISKDIIDRTFLNGYQITNKQPLISMPDDLMDFIWLLYMVGSWDWATQSSTIEEIKKHKEDIHELYLKFK
jgi:aminoglycoside phosphotransferase (APT) family kinase protein